MRSPSGFTLVEILMVILLVSIVSGIAVTQFVDFRGDAKTAVTKGRLSSFHSAIKGDAASARAGYLSDLGTIPASLNDLVVLGTKPTYNPLTKLGWNGPYVDSTVADW